MRERPPRRRTPDARWTLPPLAVLFGLNLVDELDRLAFAALTPELRDAFGLSDAQVVAVGAVAGLFIMLGALPLGWLGDRVARVRLVVVAALVWSAMSVLTGAAWAVWVLVLARALSGIARTSNEVVHPSLLVDYYRPVDQPRAFQVHRLATPLSTVLGLAVGGLGLLVGWRWTFVLIAVPTWLLVAAALSLREPSRGPAPVATAAPVARVGFGAARRAITGMPTIRRLWVAAFLLGAAFIGVTQLLSLFFEREHAFDALGRGLVQTAYGAGTVVGIVLGARAAGRAIATQRWERLPTVIAAGVLTTSAGLLLLAVTPWSGVSVAQCVLLGVGMGVWQPAFYPLVGRIVAPAIRTQAFGWTLLVSGLGAGLAVPLARLGQAEGYRLSFGLMAGCMLVAAWVLASAARRLPHDVAAAGPVLPA
ncbi:MFS transporter [Nocardioides sp. SYSU D00038]|uniref:MFS transporter n=1 Tax=Nocardioides sp. SYSU D00038 TaxID=2812554 RepID=UPI0019679C61|nr:MFS transporter [Nocardioides sp. SYSU D00038]